MQKGIRADCIGMSVVAPKPVASGRDLTLSITAQKQPLWLGSNENAERGYCSSCCCIGRSTELRKQGQIKCVWRKLAGLLWL